MATINTPIGKVRYSGVFKFALAVPSNDNKIGTRVVQRSDSGIKLIEALRPLRSGAVICPGTGKVIVYKLPGGSVVRGSS